jgi:hypothetical protein
MKDVERHRATCRKTKSCTQMKWPGPRTYLDDVALQSRCRPSFWWATKSDLQALPCVRVKGGFLPKCQQACDPCATRIRLSLGCKAYGGSVR